MDGLTGFKFISVRKLAAIDMAFYGYNLILAEYALGVILCAAVSLFIIPSDFALGIYLLFIALNYVPLLIYAILIAKGKTAREEVAADLENPKKKVWKYTSQQFFILVPLAIVLLAVYQEFESAKKE